MPGGPQCNAATANQREDDTDLERETDDTDLEREMAVEVASLRKVVIPFFDSNQLPPCQPLGSRVYKVTLDSS